MAYNWIQSISTGSLIDAADLNEIELVADEVINYTCPSNYTTVDRGDCGDDSDHSDRGDNGDNSSDNSFNGQDTSDRSHDSICA